MQTRPLGIDLKVERIRADVKVKDLASAMGITPSRLSRIEGDRIHPVTPKMEQRYRDALASCGTSGTSGKAA